MKAFKPHLASPPPYPYEHVDARVKLDQNESPYDLPADLKRRALERIEALAWNRYPELHARDVRDAIARFTGWDPAGVALAPGSNFLVLALAQAARRVLDTSPSFAYYEGGATLSGVDYRALPLADGFSLPVAPLTAALTQGEAGVLFVATPHAPTGTPFPREQVAEVVGTATSRGWIVVLDEAYHQFAGADMSDLARRDAGVVLLRTFSKAWSLGGVRAGYLLGAPDIARTVQAMLPPFLLPAPTQAILLTALESPQYVADLARRVVAERERLRVRLLAHPRWTVYPSATNFLLVRTPDAAQAFRHLLARGVLVRRQDRYPALAGCLRVTVGSPEENDAFLEAAFAPGA